MSTKEATRRGPLHDRWALAVKERAGWRCEGCGMGVDEIRRRGGNLEAAHVLPRTEYPDVQYDPANGKALCTFRNRRHPRRLGNGFGCHNAMSGHWGHAYGTMPARAKAHRSRRLAMPRHKLPAFGSLFAAGVLWGLHLPGWGGLWPWGALLASLALWPELGLATALWVLLLALGFHSHRLHAPATLGGYLGWMAALLGAWLACLGVVTAGLGWLRRKRP